MRSKYSEFQRAESGEFGFPVSRTESDLGSGVGVNSAEEVVGEIGLVLLVILGAIVTINMLLVDLHVGQ